eukprot:COSAG01_NODE_64169_length_277_cov_1.101124_1_plen_46_part_01
MARPRALATLAMDVAARNGHAGRSHQLRKGAVWSGECDRFVLTGVA